MFGLGSAKKKARGGSGGTGEKVNKYFLIHVHSLSPWPSYDNGKALELVWKVDKVQTKTRASLCLNTYA